MVLIIIWDKFLRVEEAYGDVTYTSGIVLFGQQNIPKAKTVRGKRFSTYQELGKVVAAATGC